MTAIAKRFGRSKDLTHAECCGRVCDARCREASIREHQFDRRLSTVGSVRMS